MEIHTALVDKLTRSSIATRSSVAEAEKLVSESIAAIGAMDFVESVADSFGEEIELTFPVAVTIDAQGLIPNTQGYNEESGTTFSLSNYFPQSNDQMYTNGVLQGRSILETANAFDSRSAYLPTYYRVDARNYANRYTSNATSNCPHGKNVKINTAYYNSAYTYYCHADCANYVSQAIHYGGVATDDVWYPGSYAWCNVRGLYNYMVRDKSFAQASNFASCAAGGFIITYDTVADSMNHVVMCVLNDTVNRAYSAHTSDKWQCAYYSDYPYDYNDNDGNQLTALYFFFRLNNTGTQYGDTPVAP